MRARINTLFAMAVLMATPLPAWTMTWDININTSTLSGTDAILAFDFIDGDGFVNHTVQISQFLGYGALGSANVTGDVYGLLPGIVTFGDNDFENILEQQLTLGSMLQFRVDTTYLNQSGGFPDSFAFYILDSAKQSLITTSDPFSDFGLNALFAIDLTDNTSELSLFYDKSDQMSWSAEPVTNAVPTPSTLFLLMVGIGSAFLNRKVGVI